MRWPRRTRLASLLLVLLARRTHEWSAAPGRNLCGRHAARRLVAPLRCCAADEANANAAAAASNLLQNPRPSSGKEAFDGTTWSVLLQMDAGGSTIFTMQLLEDERCRFSDNDEFGTWECQGDWVVVEKPKGFFDATLFFSGKLAPPSKEKPKWRLVDGLVQQANKTATMPGATEGESIVELRDIGTFGANEFEEALLTGSTMRRFQPNDEAADEAADEDEGGT